MATLTIPRRVEFVRPATAFIVQAARALDVAATAHPVFEVAVSEAITNAVRHGPDPGPDSTVTCELEAAPGSLTVRVLGGGERFDLPRTRLIDASRDGIDTLPASGYGVPIMQAVFPIVRVVHVQGRFGVEMTLRY